MYYIDQRALAAHRDRMALREARAEFETFRRRGAADELRTACALAQLIARRRKFGAIGLVSFLVFPILVMLASELRGRENGPASLSETSWPQPHHPVPDEAVQIPRAPLL